jgi:hypothetical protein
METDAPAILDAGHNQIVSNRQPTRFFVTYVTRLINALSKKVENHAHSVALFAIYYKFVSIHKTLRTAPQWQQM